MLPLGFSNVSRSVLKAFVDGGRPASTQVKRPVTISTINRVSDRVILTTWPLADARVLKSVPPLDEAALKAVREWRYDPTIVDGKAVPVRMTVTVSFTRR